MSTAKRRLEEQLEEARQEEVSEYTSVADMMRDILPGDHELIASLLSFIAKIAELEEENKTLAEENDKLEWIIDSLEAERSDE